MHKKINNAVNKNKKIEIPSNPKEKLILYVSVLKVYCSINWKEEYVLSNFIKRFKDNNKVTAETINAYFFINCVLYVLIKVKIIIDMNKKFKINANINLIKV